MVPPQPGASDPDPASHNAFEFLTELCAVVAAESELQPILDWIVHRATVLLGADECSIRLLAPGVDPAKTVVTDRRNRPPEAGALSWPRMIKESVMGFLAGSPELVTPDLAADPRFTGLPREGTSVRALIAMPLRVEGRLTGMIAASEARPGRDWSRHDRQLMSILASHSAIVIEKARLRIEAESTRRLEAEKLAMEKELRVAHDIQMRLVPDAPLRCGAWEVDGRLVPARHVGGDYYDYFRRDNGRIALVIADVSGKGVPAALLVSTVQAALHAFADIGLPPVQLVEKLNRRIVHSVAEGRFVTLCYAELDETSGVLQFVNAGHVYPRLRRASGAIETLPAGGTPLGLFENRGFEQGECVLGPGDSLLMFSDGLPDARDAFMQDYDESRVDAIWRELGGGATRPVLDRLMASVSAFAGGTPQTDDQTVLAVCPAGSG